MSRLTLHALVLAVLAASLLVPGVSAAEGLLFGEQLSVSNSKAGPFPIDGTTQGSISCGEPSQLYVSITGHAYGPYPGTFTQTVNARLVDGVVDAFDVTFEIISGGTTVTGEAHYVGSGADATCREYIDDEDGSTVYQFSAGSGGGGFDALPLEYSATIEDSSGSTLETGPVQAGVNLHCWGSSTFTSNCGVATTELAFEEAFEPPPASDPPVLQALTFPGDIENGPDPVTVTVTATLTDDVGVLEGGCVEIDPEDGGGSSCSGSEITFRAPRGDAYAIGWFSHVTGDTYEATVTFPRYAVPGMWTAMVGVVDTDYQYTIFQSEDLASAGYSSALEVTGTDDTTPPVVHSISELSANRVNINEPDPLNRQVHVDLAVTDDLSGVYTVMAVFFSTMNDSYQTGSDYLGGGVYRAMASFDDEFYIGDWYLAYVSVTDVVGNTTDYYPDGAREFEVVSEVSGTVSPGGTVSSAGPDDAFRVATEITTPTGGEVSIVSSAGGVAPEGFSLLGYELDITAPAATAADPLVFRFVLHRWYLPPDLEPASVAVFRNGVQLANCTGAAGVASPDPCVSDRSWTHEGNLAIIALTSHASTWLLAAGPPLDVPGTAELATAIEDLPAGSFKARGQRDALLSRLADVQTALDSGEEQSAERQLANLRRHLDGCGTKADRDDWIVDCTAQSASRALLDELRAALQG